MIQSKFNTARCTARGWPRLFVSGRILLGGILSRSRFNDRFCANGGQGRVVGGWLVVGEGVIASTFSQMDWSGETGADGHGMRRVAGRLIEFIARLEASDEVIQTE